jgi:hypothetical protein
LHSLTKARRPDINKYTPHEITSTNLLYFDAAIPIAIVSARDKTLASPIDFEALYPFIIL